MWFRRQSRVSRSSIKRKLSCWETLEDRRLLAVITVDTLTDESDGSILDGDTSLRDAIATADSGDTIDFGAVLDGGTILLTQGEVVVTKSMTIDATALPNGLTIDASGNDPTPDENNHDGSRVFNVDDGDTGNDGEMMIRGLTLTGGDTSIGGAIRSKGNLTVTDSTITGNSASDDGGGIYAFNLEADVTVTIISSIISGNTAGDSGGGVSTYSNRNVAVMVTSSTISGNTADDNGGGVYAYSERDITVTVSSSTISGNMTGDNGGGITAYSEEGVAVTIASSTISGNTAGRSIGGIDASSGYGHATVTINSSTVSGNTAGDNGGGVYAFSVYGDATATINSSTISGNTAGDNGGGVVAYSAYEDVTVTINSSTISGNIAGASGGGLYAFSAYGDVTVAITSSTISANLARTGGGIRASDAMSIENTIVAGNSDDSLSPDIRHGDDTPTVRFSLIGDNTGTSLTEAQTASGNGNLIGNPNGGGIIDPQLGPLADNGGPTQTHTLLSGSPAINAGDPRLAAPQDFDQRGTPFVRIADDGIDMGAFESQPSPIDFNGDKFVDVADIDALVAAIVDAGHPLAFDLTGDAVVDLADVDVWLSLSGLENLSSREPYLPGDANLDGVVDVLDFNIWSDHRFAETAMWSSADFNADGFTDGSDFNIWNRQAFTAADHDRARSPGGVADRVPRAPLRDNVQAAPQMAATDTQSISKIERPTDFDASKAISTDTIWRNRFRHDALPSNPSLHQSMTDNAQVRLIDDVLGQW